MIALHFREHVLVRSKPNLLHFWYKLVAVLGFSVCHCIRVIHKRKNEDRLLIQHEGLSFNMLLSNFLKSDTCRRHSFTLE